MRVEDLDLALGVESVNRSLDRIERNKLIIWMVILVKSGIMMSAETGPHSGPLDLVIQSVN